LNAKSLLLLAFIGVLLVLPLFANGVSAQTQPNYYVTVKPALISNAVTYTSVDKNATLSFQASWTYGPDETKNIQNATVIIQISNPDGKVVDMLSVNTTSGIFSFNYTSADPKTLAFTPTDLITQDGRDWNSSILDSANNVYGFTSNWAQVWWDTFHVSMISRDTGSLGNVAVSVNVTYQLLPEDGLQVGAVHVFKTAGRKRHRQRRESKRNADPRNLLRQQLNLATHRIRQSRRFTRRLDNNPHSVQL
jgi:hypothetical protein